jgi:hypothetical protein
MSTLAVSTLFLNSSTPLYHVSETSISSTAELTNLTLDTEVMQSPVPLRPPNHPKWPLEYQGCLISLLLNTAPAFGSILGGLRISCGVARRYRGYLEDGLRFYKALAVTDTEAGNCNLRSGTTIGSRSSRLFPERVTTLCTA